MNATDTATLEMAQLCEQHAVKVDGALAVRLQRYAGAMRKCRPNSRCGMDACPRCNRRHLKRNVKIVETLIRSIAPESLRVLVFDIPGVVVPSDMEQVLTRVLQVMTRLTKGNTVWARLFSRWAGLIRARLEPQQTDGPAAFRFSIRFIAEAKAMTDLMELEKRWRLLLHSLGLVTVTTDPAETPLVKVVTAHEDAHRQARKLCRSSSSWLAPISVLSASDVIAYHRVLPRLLNLRAPGAV